MLGYPPRLITNLPDNTSFDPAEWIAQPRSVGWRVLIHKDNVYTLTGKIILNNIGYPKTNFDYQLDVEMINPQKQTAAKVREALNKGIQKMEVFDAYLPFAKDMSLSDRLVFLKKELNIAVPALAVCSYDDLSRMVNTVKMYGYGRLVIKRKDSVYKISKHCCLVDHNWVKVSFTLRAIRNYQIRIVRTVKSVSR